jgi:hypothetical protein
MCEKESATPNKIRRTRTIVKSAVSKKRIAGWKSNENEKARGEVKQKSHRW